MTISSFEQKYQQHKIITSLCLRWVSHCISILNCFSWKWDAHIFCIQANCWGWIDEQYCHMLSPIYSKILCITKCQVNLKHALLSKWCQIRTVQWTSNSLSRSKFLWEIKRKTFHTINCIPELTRNQMKVITQNLLVFSLYLLPKQYHSKVS